MTGPHVCRCPRDPRQLFDARFNLPPHGPNDCPRNPAFAGQVPLTPEDGQRPSTPEDGQAVTTR